MASQPVTEKALKLRLREFKKKYSRTAEDKVNNVERFGAGEPTSRVAPINFAIHSSLSRRSLKEDWFAS